jgi:hypothetical protein
VKLLYSHSRIFPQRRKAGEPGPVSWFGEVAIFEVETSCGLAEKIEIFSAGAIFCARCALRGCEKARFVVLLPIRIADEGVRITQ